MEPPKVSSPRRGYLADSLAFNLLPRKDYLREYREKFGKKSALGENNEVTEPVGAEDSRSLRSTNSQAKTCDLIAKYLKKDYPSSLRLDALNKTEKSPDLPNQLSPTSRIAAILTNPGIVRYLGASTPDERQSLRSPRELSATSRPLSSSVSDLSQLSWSETTRENGKSDRPSTARSSDLSPYIPTFKEFKQMKKADKIRIFVQSKNSSNIDSKSEQFSPGLRRATSEQSLFFSNSSYSNSDDDEKDGASKSFPGTDGNPGPSTSFETHMKTSNPTRPKIMTRCHSDVSGGRQAEVKKVPKKRHSIDETNAPSEGNKLHVPSAMNGISDFGKTFVIEKRKKSRDGDGSKQNSTSGNQLSRDKRSKSDRKNEKRERNDDVFPKSSNKNKRVVNHTLELPISDKLLSRNAQRELNTPTSDDDKSRSRTKTKSKSAKTKHRSSSERRSDSRKDSKRSSSSVRIDRSVDNSGELAVGETLPKNTKDGEIPKQSRRNQDQKERERRKKHRSSSKSAQENGLGETEDDEMLLQRKQHITMHSTREDILSYLDDIKRSGFAPADDSSSLHSSEECFGGSMYSQDASSSKTAINRNTSFASTCSSLSSSGNHKKRSESSEKNTEIERVDSGVGSETKAVPTIRVNEIDIQGIVCEDCDKVINPDGESLEDEHLLSYYVCQRCEAKRIERSEAIREIVDTEVSYGRDLQVIREEFYIPIHTAGLLTTEQMNTVFINLDELITINSQFVNTLQDALDIAMDTGDEDLTTVGVGHLFLEYSNMFLAFENYCVNQTGVPAFLELLQKEKELLRIFLYVSQTENSLLRRMNLKSFLMVPIQRVMKYPLLLSRLNKTTPVHHKDKEAVKQAQQRIEQILEHINNKTGGSAGLRLKHRQSSKKSKTVENLELVKVALDALHWTRQQAHIITCGQIKYVQPSDTAWVKKVKQLKWSQVHALLVTMGKPDYYEVNRETFVFPKSSRVQHAALVLVREKAGKFIPLKEPVFLEKSLVSMNQGYTEAFELITVGEELCVLKCDESTETLALFNHMKHITLSLGNWRKRRPGLANIMMKNKVHSHVT